MSRAKLLFCSYVSFFQVSNIIILHTKIMYIYFITLLIFIINSMSSGQFNKDFDSASFVMKMKYQKVMD